MPRPTDEPPEGAVDFPVGCDVAAPAVSVAGRRRRCPSSCWKTAAIRRVVPSSSGYRQAVVPARSPDLVASLHHRPGHRGARRNRREEVAKYLLHLPPLRVGDVENHVGARRSPVSASDQPPLPPATGTATGLWQSPPPRRRSAGGGRAPGFCGAAARGAVANQGRTLPARAAVAAAVWRAVEAAVTAPVGRGEGAFGGGRG